MPGLEVYPGGHAPDLSKPDSFDFLCNRLNGAWRIPTLLLFMSIHLRLESQSFLDIFTIKVLPIYSE
ncbi:MAG: hypothetical protein KKH79_00870, partial [Candidatus Thermoplasmatota archaeon]|nr:hypothetical protein [Candidatus Thermoplasmatota archaeon]